MRGVSSLAPLMACPMDMTSWIRRSNGHFIYADLERGLAFFFLFYATLLLSGALIV